jgi:rod shape determining protein RodA
MRWVGEQRESFLVRAVKWLKLDPALLLMLGLLMVVSCLVLYSAGGSVDLVIRQVVRFALALGVMLALAQISPHILRLWSPWMYLAGVIMLVGVALFGVSGKGAQRWLDLGVIRFQPSEMMKLAMPMMVAWFLAGRPLPPDFRQIVLSLVLIAIPMLLIVRQPDLGTALLVGSAGFFALFLAGISWRVLWSGGLLGLIAAPVMWLFVMRDYQKQRVLTFLSPESDPLGSGYHIIQSKIAIGSGGPLGKGWMNGSQSQLDFLPEQSTDFIFSVFGEEFGFLGGLLLLLLYALILIRCLMIASKAQESYSRLLAGSIGLTFFVYLFVNIGMVSGLLPVVGVPLPMISYGGTSIVTLAAGFGILMSVNAHRRLMNG